MVEASESSNADDEHDPEGSTIAFERQQAAALLGPGPGHRGGAAALAGGGRVGHVRHLRGAAAAPIDPARLEARPAGAHLHRLRATGLDEALSPTTSARPARERRLCGRMPAAAAAGRRRYGVERPAPGRVTRPDGPAGAFSPRRRP